MSIDRLQENSLQENSLQENGAHDGARESVTPNQTIEQTVEAAEAVEVTQREAEAVNGSAADGSMADDSISSVPAMQSDMALVWMRVMGMAIALLTAFLFTFWGIHSLQHSDPYVQSVLQISGNPDRGRDIFALNCATCHGLDANGEVGPNLSGVSERKSRTALIKQVISGQTPPMPQFQPNEKDMADLLSFLRTL